jgi:hypothetical protein
VNPAGRPSPVSTDRPATDKPFNDYTTSSDNTGSTVLSVTAIETPSGQIGPDGATTREGKQQDRPMPKYQPILKAKPAEFSAWEHASSSVRAASSPLFELAPSEKLENYLKTFITSAEKSLDAGEVITVDAAEVHQDRAWAPGKPCIVEWLGTELKAKSVTLRPVARLTDSATVLADIAAVAKAHGAGVTLRLGTDTDDPDLAAFRTALPSLLTALGIDDSKLHLLLDFRYVSTAKDVSRALPVLNSWLAWIGAHPAPFGSVHAGAGAFPASVSGLPVATQNLVERLDAAFFNAATVPEVVDLGFADYAVNHPVLGPVIPRAPLPSMRYLTDDDWLVRRESKSAIGNQAFFTVCGAIVGDPSWKGASYSWGDNEIERSSRRVGGAGTATHWRAYGTSHHLASIVDRLATLGAP